MTEFVTLNSSNLESAGYDEAAETLYVNFKKGYCYRYVNVPAFVFQSLIEAGSPGTYFNANIQHAFPYERC